jgi:hypothetical protein
MWANDPKMARRWTKHTRTPISSLPKKVKKHEEIDEMPHIDVNKDVEGMHFGTVDLNFEKYPGFSKGDREQFMRNYEQEGVIARMRNGRWLFFSPDGDVRLATSEQITSLQKLPGDWFNYMTNIDVDESPKMTEVFIKK